MSKRCLPVVAILFVWIFVLMGCQNRDIKQIHVMHKISEDEDENSIQTSIDSIEIMEFVGVMEWSEPYEKMKYLIQPISDEYGNLISNADTIEVAMIVRKAERVKWEISNSCFSLFACVESVKYSEGDRALRIEGPGIESTFLNVGQIKKGNMECPNGIWYGYFWPTEIVRDENVKHCEYTLVLTVKSNGQREESRKISSGF